MNSWAMSAESILEEYQVDNHSGLSTEEAGKRLEVYGINAIRVKKKTSAIVIFFHQFKSPVIYILLTAAVIAFFLGERIDAGVILAIVILNTLIGFVQELKAESSIDALEKLSSPKSKVLRDGNLVEIDSKNLCPGDILSIEAGDYIGADARLISTRQLTCDESILTGESLPVEKNNSILPQETILPERTNMVFAGTAITNGTAIAVVTATAKKTEIGKIASLMDSTQVEATPLQKKLERVSDLLLLLGVLVIIAVCLIGFWRGWNWMEIIMTSLAISIAAIPEGLPTVVTIALVMAVRRMSHKKALVRKMHSVETLGTTDVICTDKTGTLTTGKMTVRDVYSITDKTIINSIMMFCNNASLQGEGTGDTTEIALLNYVKNQSEIPEQKRVWEWSFESKRKRMSVAVINEDTTYIYSKGAPEAILDVCSVDQSVKKEMIDKANFFSENGMRVLGLAYRKVDQTDFHNMPINDAENSLTFAGLVAITDPPREESIEAVKKCKKAGIRVVMITGDHPKTASAIAYELGIVSSQKNQVLTGQEMDKLSDDEISDLVSRVNVYARVSPENKLQLIKALKKKDLVVAMTGDGVNDALALKAASIGVAMGKGGTEVARQASSMVLTDDNFATIVHAVEEGRAVNGNIKRTLQYLLSTNLAELLFILSATIVGWPVPLSPINLLWINLVTDGLPSLALAAEKVPPHFLERSHRPTSKSFFDRPFYNEMIITGIMITLLGLFIYHWGVENKDIETGRSYAFCFFVYAALFRSFASRSEYQIFIKMKLNVYHLMSCLVPLILQIGMQFSPVFLDIFEMKKLSLGENVFLISISLIPLLALEINKLITYRKRNKESEYVVC